MSRAAKINTISPEAKQAAREAGLDKNQSALLKIAAAPVAEQVAAVERIVTEKAERAEARHDHAPEQSGDPKSVFDPATAFVDYVVAHVSEDDIPGLLGVMKGLTAEQMVRALEARDSGH